MKRYHTQSGSIYEVRDLGGATMVRRRKLGELHTELGTVEKRAGDGLDQQRRVLETYCPGVGYALIIRFSNEDSGRDLITSPVTSIEDLDAAEDS